jgi:hypothetical protein
MTLREAYIYIFGILDGYWENSHNSELGILLGGFTFWHPLSNDEKTADPAAWKDWIDAVRKITVSDSINNIEALQASVYLMKEYNDHQGFQLNEVIHLLETKLEKQLEATKTWKRNQNTI